MRLARANNIAAINIWSSPDVLADPTFSPFSGYHLRILLTLSIFEQ